ncbi:hypothetical protein JCM3774_004957 [Rhodotorula dairenensis]
MASTAVPEVHCALVSCRTLDFLPLTCPHCASTFCRHHASPSAHACPRDPSQQRVEPGTLPRPQGRDRVEVRDLLPDPKRHKANGDRDDPAMATDPAQLERKAKQAAALAKLRASFGGKERSGQTSGTAIPTRAKPANPALELMRLKQRAVAADPKHLKRPGDVSMADRVYFHVSYTDAEGARCGEAKPVWISETTSVGRALDLFADLFKVNNINNSTADPTKLLTLAVDQDPPVKLVLPDPLAGQVPNGGRVVLLKGHTWPS